ncbi:archaeosortase C [Candidatus Alkanophaga liquidiphilum]
MGVNVAKIKSETLLLLLIIFLIGAFIELTYGSAVIGAIFLCVCAGILFILSGREAKAERKASKLLIAVGAALIVADLSYNYLLGSAVQTLDSMIILLGGSLILANTRNKRLCELGAFSTYMSLFFIVFFAALYVIPSRFDIGIPKYYGHYFVALPVSSVLRALGLRLDVPTMNVIEVRGVEPVWLRMDLACFGWYSMLLIISTLLAYDLTIKSYERRKLLKILAIMTVASYAANLLRVSTLAVIAYYYGVDMMMFFHSHLGWILFAAILIPLMYIFLK